MASEDEAALFRTTFSDSPVGMSVATPDGRVLAVNPALCSLLGYPAAELLTMSLDDVVHPDDLPHSREGLRALLSGAHASWVAERCSLRKDGEAVWTRVTAVLERDADGAPLYLRTYFEDIAHELEAKQALRESEERHRRALDAAQVGMYSCTVDDGAIVTANQQLADLLECTVDELLANHTAIDWVEPDAYAGMVSTLRDGGDVSNREIGVRTTTGERRTVLLSLRLQTGESHLEGAVVDISDRKRTEGALLLALRERVKELTCLFELSRMIERPGIDIDDILRGTAELLPSAFRHADVAGARIGVEGAEFASPGFIASRWRLSVPLELFGVPLGLVEVCYREERPPADNGPFLAEELALLKTVAQRLEHVVERYRAAIRLQVSEERFALAARAANDGIWDWDLTTEEVMLSPRWKSMLGYDEDELTDSIATWDALLHPDDKDSVWESMSRYLAGSSDIYEGESLLRHKDGHYVPVLMRGFALRRESDGAAQRFVGTITDLTELTAVEASLHEAIAELRSSNQELEQFAYVASHDLQEPLRMVASYTQLLARRYGDQLDQDAQDFIGYAVDGATRMQQLIQDLLAYSRVTTRGAPAAPVDVQGALDEALMNLESAIAESGAVVTADDLPAVLGDRTQVVQVLQNLIGNGIKFRRPEVSPHVNLSARPDPGDDSLWLFQVADNGIGIDLKHADRVFVIFQRLHGRQEYPGTGIGLALCKRIVERHGGTIWLQPNPADGTTVNFTLPKAERGRSREGDTDERSDQWPTSGDPTRRGQRGRCPSCQRGDAREQDAKYPASCVRRRRSHGVPAPRRQVRGRSAAVPDPTRSQSPQDGRPRGAGRGQVGRRVEEHPHRRPHGEQLRRGHPRQLRPSCELLHHQARRPDAVHQGRALDRRLLADYRQASRQCSRPAPERVPGEAVSAQYMGEVRLAHSGSHVAILISA